MINLFLPLYIFIYPLDLTIVCSLCFFMKETDAKGYLLIDLNFRSLIKKAHHPVKIIYTSRTTLTAKYNSTVDYNK